MPTILHISDLHRTSDPRLNNDELLAAILSDATRWEADGIPWPDLIVVSGDVIQGVPAEAQEPDLEIEKQYAEAKDFLEKLGAKIVNSDRSRIIIVPGNHDVNWSRARRAMNLLEPCPDDIARAALQSDSNVRWNWKDQKAYRVNDSNMYQTRFDHFRRFQSDFYDGVSPSPLSHGDKDLVYFEDLSLGLVVVGFASWHGNDCFCTVGEIAQQSVTYSRELVADSMAPVAVAVWHHSIIGGPRAQDYMDARDIHRLIDFGFTVGLHGHQHYPGAAPFELRLPNLASMVVVAGGSIAVGDSELPMGEQRQFNVVVIDPSSGSITVHVRAMSRGGVFAGSHRDDFGGNTFIKLDLPLSSSRPRKDTATGRLDDAMTAVSEGNYEKALDLIRGVASSYYETTRLISIQALDGLGHRDELVELLDPPQSIEEAFKVISMFLDDGRFDEAFAKLESVRELVGQANYEEVTQVINARRMNS